MLIAGIISRMTAPRPADLPIFPLSTVLLPGSLLPLRLFEARYLDMASACMREGSPFGVCLIREGQEVGTPAVPEGVGCTACITDWDMVEQGILKIKVRGADRFRLTHLRTEANGLLVGQVSTLPLERHPIEARFSPAAAFLRQVIEQIGPENFLEPFAFDDAGWVSFRLTEILPLRLMAKQKLLELDDGNQRLDVLSRFLREQKLVA
jgi:hypothetical protein